MAEKIRVQAITTVHLTVTPGKAGDKEKGIAPVRPKQKVIQPGTLFVLDKAEFEELASLGAVKAVKDTDKVEVDAKDAPNGDGGKAGGGKTASPAGKGDGGKGDGGKSGDAAKDLV